MDWDALSVVFWVSHPDYETIVARVQVVSGEVCTHQEIPVGIESASVNGLRLLSSRSDAELADQIRDL